VRPTKPDTVAIGAAASASAWRTLTSMRRMPGTSVCVTACSHFHFWPA